MAKATRYTQQLIDEYTKRGYWESTTLSDFWDRNAANCPDKEAIVDSKTRLTWGQAKQWIDRLALGFLELGIKKDEMIVLQLPNCVELFMLIVACEKAGILSLPIARTLRHKEVEYILKQVEAVGVVIPWEYRKFDHFEMIEEIRPNLPQLKYVFIVDEKIPEGAISIKQMVQQPLEEKYPADYLEKTKTPATEFSLVLPTSGTTGFPKFVEYAMCGRLLSGKGRVQETKYTSDDVFNVFGYGFGAHIAACFCAPQVAGKIVMLEHFEPEKALKLIEKEGITIMGTSPLL